MIEIITSNGISLDLSPDADFSIEYESPIFDDSRMPVPFSTDISFPTSPTNNAEFGYWPGVFELPSRLSLPAAMYASGVVIMTGKLVFSEIEDGCLRYSFSGSAISESLEAMDIAELVPQKRVLEDNLQAIKRGEFLLVKAPLLIDEAHVAEAIYTSVDGNTEGCSEYSRYLNFYTDGDPNRFIPAFPLCQFVYNIFGLSSKSISFDPNIEAWLKAVHILGQYKPAATDGKTGLWSDVSGILLSRTLPDVNAAEFLSNILKMFCCALFSVEGGYSVRPLSNIVTGEASENWNDKTGDFSDFGREFASAYVFGYSNDDENNSYSEDQLESDIQAGTTLESNNLGTLGELTVRDEYKVIHHSSSGYVLSGKKTLCSVVSERDGNIWASDQILLDSILHPIKAVSVRGNNEEDSEFDSSVEFNLVRCIPEYVNTVARNVYANIPKVAPIIKVPDIGNERGRDMYIGIVVHNQMTDSGVVFDSGNDTIEYKSPYCLSPQFMYETFYRRFAEWLLKDKVAITVPLRLSVLDLASFSMDKKVYFRGREWIVKKLSVSMSVLSDIVEVTGEFVSA